MDINNLDYEKIIKDLSQDEEKNVLDVVIGMGFNITSTNAREIFDMCFKIEAVLLEMGVERRILCRKSDYILKEK